MARTHARVAGKSGSTRPVEADLSFVTIKDKEVVKIILAMAKNDIKPSVIGLTLRDQHGVPSIKELCGKSITAILAENDMAAKLPEDLFLLTVKADNLKKHLGKNKRDTHNTRGLQLIEAKVRRLSKYYKNTGRIESGWNYK
jgi:small subunit ribosomal protein S15